MNKRHTIQRHEWTVEEVTREMKAVSTPGHVDHFAQSDAGNQNRLGVPVPAIRKLARKIGTDHSLAAYLWETGIHEMRILSPMISDPESLTEVEMEKFVTETDSWDICDNLCGELLLHSRFADKKIHEWSFREDEFVKRAAYALIAYSAVHKKGLPDSVFVSYLELVRTTSSGSPRYAKQGADWAIRQTGKRNSDLNKKAIVVAEMLKNSKDRSSRWIGQTSLRELNSDSVQERLLKKREKVKK